MVSERNILFNRNRFQKNNYRVGHSDNHCSDDTIGPHRGTTVAKRNMEHERTAKLLG